MCNRECKRNKGRYCVAQRIWCFYCCFVFVFCLQWTWMCFIFHGKIVMRKRREMFGLKKKMESTGNDWRTLFNAYFQRDVLFAQLTAFFYVQIRMKKKKTEENQAIIHIKINHMMDWTGICTAGSKSKFLSRHRGMSPLQESKSHDSK